MKPRPVIINPGRKVDPNREHAALFGSARTVEDQDIHDHGLPWLRAGRD